MKTLYSKSDEEEKEAKILSTSNGPSKEGATTELSRGKGVERFVEDVTLGNEDEGVEGELGE